MRSPNSRAIAMSGSSVQWITTRSTVAGSRASSRWAYAMGQSSIAGIVRACVVNGGRRGRNASIADRSGCTVDSMKRTVILSHGLESGPEATKVTALAAACADLGWDSVRPDYRVIDARRDPMAIDERIECLLAHVPG